MVIRSVIGFDEDLRKVIDVKFAVAPIDALTGRIVQGNVTASVTVEGETAESEALVLPDKPIRNLSGLLIFTDNLPDHTKYRVHVKARTAGYFDPEPIDFTPPERNGKNALDLKDLLRIDFTLFPRPDFTFDGEATLISGVVVRGNNAVEGARISVIVPLDDGMANPRLPQIFETRSDERGAFALALGLPAFSENQGNAEGVSNSIQGVQVEFRIETKGEDKKWLLELKFVKQEVIDGRRRVFKKPIDLNDIKDPGLLTV